MTWLSRTSFSLILAAQAQAGTLAGEFELTGSREAAVMKLKDYSGVIVWLEPLSGPAPIAARRTFTINQKNKRFIPHVVVMPMGSELAFPNNDPIFHNAFSTFSGQPFDTGLYPPGATQKIVFRRAGIVRVFCNIHSNMSAVIVVTPSPYFAISSKDGRFNIANIPAGDYLLKVWHERSTDAVLRGVERRVHIGDSATPLGNIQLSEAGHASLPHKDKNGKEYPPVPNERMLYPGGN